MFALEGALVRRSLCPLSLGWVGCSLGFQGCLGLIQGSQGPQDRTLERTLARHPVFSSSGAAWEESGHQSQCPPIIKQLLSWQWKTQMGALVL